MRGKLIVIDGTNGSGKTEQTRLLAERLRQEGLPVSDLSYPRYGTSTGKAVEAYLAGAFGQTADVHARHASVLYAVDRWASHKEGAFNGLERGEHLIANRYAASNMAHQGSLLHDPSERSEFFRWNDELEHVFFGIPRPDLNVILHVPADVTMELIERRGNAKDQHENLAHQRAAEATYLEIARTFPGFVLIECVRDGRLLSIPEVHELVWAEVRKVLELQPA